MGLAASQARLLFLTSRQNDIEFSQMRIANDKISLSRDTEGISEDYNRALNQRKLLWSADSSATSATAYDLTYPLIMTPNTANTAGQYILTNNNGQVVLSDDYIKKIGLATSGNPGELGMTRNQFLAKFSVNGKTLDGLQYEDKYKELSGSAKAPNPYLTRSSMTDATALTIKTEVSTLQTAFSSGRRSPAFLEALTKLQNQITTSTAAALTAKQNLEANSTCYNDITTIDGKNYQQYTKEYDSLLAFKNILAYVANLNEGAINSADNLPGDPCVGDGNGPKREEFRVDLMTALISGTTKSVSSGDFRNGGLFSESDASSNRPGEINNVFIANGLTQYLSFSWDNSGSGLGGRGRSYTFSGANGYSGIGSLLANTRTGCAPSTKTETTSSEEETAADYYTNLYYAILEKGWKNNSSVTDKSYLQNQLMNGNLQLEKLTESYTWDTLTSSDAETPVRNVADDDAITQAESVYNTAKSKLETKESLLDLQAKNLDAERSEIVTETDSVKKIIDKNIEKSFKMFA